MTHLPGGMAWHAPLAVCSPGVVILIGALASACLPSGRGRWWVGASSLALGLLVLLAVLWASLVQDGGRLSLISGWCEGGPAWVVLAGVAGAVSFFSARGPVRVALVGVGFLSIVMGTWWCHLLLAVVVLAWSRVTERGRVSLLSWAVILVMTAALSLSFGVWS